MKMTYCSNELWLINRFERKILSVITKKIFLYDVK